jgi:molybdopterin converting factor small subunit
MMSKLVRVAIHYYAQLRENLRLPLEEIELELPTTEEKILRRLAKAHPSQEKLILASRAAINDAYLPQGTVIEELESVDIISPVSGG